MSAPCSTMVSTISLCSSALMRDARARAARRAWRAPRAMSARIERHVEGVDEVLAQVGDEAAQRIGEPRPRRHQHLRDAELARQRHRVQRPGAAEGEQREVARIEAARQRHHADGAGHVRVAEPDHGRGRLVDAEAQAAWRASRRRRRAPAPPSPAATPRAGPLGSSRPSTRLASVMVGSRAAAAVADRAPARSPPTRGPTCSMPGRIDRGDRAAAGADAAARPPSARGSAGRSRW